MSKRYGHNTRIVMSIALGETDISVKPDFPWYSRDEAKMPVIMFSYDNGQEEIICLSKQAVDNLLQILAQVRDLPEQQPRSVFSVSH